MLRSILMVFCLLAAPLLGQGEGRPAFRSFGPEQGLKATWTLALEQDERGFIWAGTDSGLFRCDGERFLGIPGPSALGPIQAIACLPNGRLFAAGAGGLATHEAGRLRLLTPKEGLPAGPATAVGQDGQGRAWVLLDGYPYCETSPGRFQIAPGWPVGQRAEDLRVQPDSTTVVTVVGDHLLRGTVNADTWEASPGPGGPLLQAVYDGTGRLWVRNEHQIWGQTPNQRWESLRKHFPIVETYGLERRRDGRVWASTNVGPIGLRGTSRVQVPTNPLFPYVNLRSTLVDHEGGLWLSCMGVQRLLGRNLVRQYGSGEGLEGYSTWSLRRDQQQRLWAGTQAGLAVSTPRGFRMVVQGTFLNQVDIAPDGVIWAGGGAAQRTVYRVDPHTLKAERIVIPHFQEGRFSKGFAFVGGDVWAASAEQGIWSLTSKGSTWSWAPVPLPEGSGAVRFLRQDRDQRVWLGTDHGLYWRKARGWERLDHFADVAPHSFTQSPSGRVEVGLFGVPTFRRYQIKGDQLKALGAWNPIPWSSVTWVYSAALDAEDRLWLGTSQGAFRVDPSGGERPLFIGRQEGLPGNDCDQDGFLVEPSQDVWISTSAGLARYVGSQETATPEMAAPIVSGLTERGRLLPINLPLTLKGSLHEVELGFQVLAFNRQPRLSFEAWIEGRDARWLPLNGPRLTLTGLDPGRYQLRIRAVDEDSTRSPELMLPLVILPDWWQTWWARVLTLLALAALIAGVVRLRSDHLRRRNLNLQEQINARTLELREANARLALASEEKSKYLAGMSHELRTPLNAILLYSELISERAIEDQDEQLKDDASRVHASGKHLLQLINGVLDIAKIEAGMMDVLLERVDPVAVAKEALENVELLARAKRCETRLEVPLEPTEFICDSGKLRQILINLLGNAVKFTEEGRITLRISAAADQVVFEVEDTGIGMSEDQLGRVFQVFQQAEGVHTQRLYGGSGLGLSLSLKLAERLGGRLLVKSHKGQGSCFTLSLPRLDHDQASAFKS
jgi:signal transduction histidine kinase/ligand-binding sensor domain-containing protein